MNVAVQLASGWSCTADANAARAPCTTPTRLWSGARNQAHPERRPAGSAAAIVRPHAYNARQDHVHELDHPMLYLKACRVASLQQQPARGPGAKQDSRHARGTCFRSFVQAETPESRRAQIKGGEQAQGPPHVLSHRVPVPSTVRRGRALASLGLSPWCVATAKLAKRPRAAHTAQAAGAADLQRCAASLRRATAAPPRRISQPFCCRFALFPPILGATFLVMRVRPFFCACFVHVFWSSSGPAVKCDHMVS